MKQNHEKTANLTENMLDQEAIAKKHPRREGQTIGVYFNAKDLAKKWGHHPPFLKRYGQMAMLSVGLLCVGALIMLLSLL